MGYASDNIQQPPYGNLQEIYHWRARPQRGLVLSQIGAGDEKERFDQTGYAASA